jgi:hypothetical protein
VVCKFFLQNKFHFLFSFLPFLSKFIFVLKTNKYQKK